MTLQLIVQVAIFMECSIGKRVVGGHVVWGAAGSSIGVVRQSALSAGTPHASHCRETVQAFLQSLPFAPASVCGVDHGAGPVVQAAAPPVRRCMAFRFCGTREKVSCLCASSMR